MNALQGRLPQFILIKNTGPFGGEQVTMGMIMASLGESSVFVFIIFTSAVLRALRTLRTPFLVGFSFSLWVETYESGNDIDYRNQ